MLVNELLAPLLVFVTVTIIKWLTFYHLLIAEAGSRLKRHSSHHDDVTDEGTSVIPVWSVVSVFSLHARYKVSGIPPLSGLEHTVHSVFPKDIPKFGVLMMSVQSLP